MFECLAPFFAVWFQKYIELYSLIEVITCLTNSIIVRVDFPHIPVYIFITFL
jgi:hypothetical protein